MKVMYTSLTNTAAYKFYFFLLYAEYITRCKKVDEINYFRILYRIRIAKCSF